MGWRSGEVTLCNVKEDKIWEQSSCHHGPITLVQWGGAGTKLVTADRVCRDTAVLAMYNCVPLRVDC